MKKTVITLAAALALSAPMAALAQEQDPNQVPVIIPDQQPGQAEQPVKRKKKHQAEQPAEQAQQPEQQQIEQQVEQPVKRKKKQQFEQPAEQAQQPEQQIEQQVEQPVKRKKKHQIEQPAEQAQQPEQQIEQQVEQPVKRKKKQQIEQPVEQTQQPEQQIEQQVEQPVKKKKKQQVEQPVEQAQPEAQPQLGAEPEQPVKKKEKQQVEQPVEQGQPEAQPQFGAEPDQPVKKKKKEQVEQPGEPTQPEQTTGQPQPGKPVSAEAPPEVTQYLSDTRSPKELSDEELVARVRNGRNLVRMKGLPDNVRQGLASEFKKARAEAMARDQAKATGKLPEQGQPAGEQPPAGETTTGKGDQVPPQGEGQPAQPTDEAAQPNPDKKQVQQLDGNKAVPEAEAKAKTYLSDSRPADQLKDDELRARLDGVRDLLASNQLSGDTERALRRRLRDEKEILRSRVAEKVVGEEKKDDVIPGRERRRDRNDDRKWDSWAERDILRDRRRSDELEEGELRRRIDVYRVAIYDDQYDDQERAYWRGMMDRDRLYLRDRLMEDRRDRENYWRDRRDRNEINIDINIDLGPDREPPEAAFMDEIDDEELQDYLVAAPRRKIPRRYTVAEIEEEPDVRTAMPAIEIDSIHFGFNESFVREEEVGKLDRIAEVIEKILAAHPGEVFMIAGYTDAVGSDAYNLNLSRQRAQAVKKALTTYYVIPAKNLVTAGYGERYLKIPTADAEEENRRVSLQRVTPLVGEAE